MPKSHQDWSWACSHCGTLFPTRKVAAAHETSVHGVTPRRKRRKIGLQQRAMRHIKWCDKRIAKDLAAIESAMTRKRRPRKTV